MYVKVNTDMISQTRSKSGNWEFYDKEDIEDGFLVIGGVAELEFSLSGAIPGDYILSFSIDHLSDEIYQCVIDSVAITGRFSGQIV